MSDNPSSTPPRRAHTNRILSSLPREEYARIAPQLEAVELRLGENLYEPDSAIDYVYFPFTGTISLTLLMSDGGETEIGIVGREGMLGLPLLLGTRSAPLRAMVQMPLKGVRLRASAFTEESERRGKMFDKLLCYAQAFFVQTAVTAACNRLHTIDGRLAKWLLTAVDRAQSETLTLTHEFLAVMLGVRRAGVTEALCALRDAGAVVYARGVIHVTDRSRLESVSCECYAIVRKEYDRLLDTESYFDDGVATLAK